MSEWKQAVEAELRCPYPGCEATNVPGKKPMVELCQRGVGFCNSCGREFSAVRLRG